MSCHNSWNKMAAAALPLLAALATGCHRSASEPPSEGREPKDRQVVLYCAVDREIAQDAIDEFQKETGISVQAKFDTEAAKAVGLVEAIRQENAYPQCDVFWGGGGFFCTMLADEGCLAALPSDLVAASGDAPHDLANRWLGFGGAYRVLIVNTNALPPSSWPHSYRDLTDPRYKGRVGIANPLFGGMAAHVAALFAKLGESGGRQWLQGIKENGCAICAGMADVKNRVASGELWFGITATDDAYVAISGGKPVVVVYPDQAPEEIGCLNGYQPVALIARAPHPKAAESLVRFLVTTRIEKVLADGPGQNVGMLPQSIAQDVRPTWIPRGVRTMGVDWSAAVRAHPAATKAIKEILFNQ